jgi:hypothetical protein
VADANKILASILNLIDKDVKSIKKLSKDHQLDPADALTLTRYAATLDNILESKDKESAKAKKDLSKLSTEELIAQYQQEKK